MLKSLLQQQFPDFCNDIELVLISRIVGREKDKNIINCFKFKRLKIKYIDKIIVLRYFN